MQPKGAKMMTRETVELLLNKIPEQGREAHRASGLMNNLVSASVLVDAGCEVFFYKTGADISYNGEIIVRGWRDLPTRLWRMSLLPDGGNNIVPSDANIIDDNSIPTIPPFLANSIFECTNTEHLIKYYHATMGYPVISTWGRAIDAGYFRGWPSLTSKRVRRHIKVTTETEMGHMDQQRQGTRSTKPKPTVIEETTPSLEDSMTLVPQTPTNDKTNHVYMTITDMAGKLYSDQTGRFPVTSNRGHCYVVIFYCVDGNYIKSFPIKSRHRSELLKAYDEVYSFLRVRGYRPQLHKLDNETSQDVENFITEQQALIQYTPADMHRTNIAERCIRTWKNHFLAIKAGTPKKFRMSNWCKMLEQCDITLNMMRPCTTNPNLSAFEAMEGMYSFDATPMAPVGTETLIHLKPIRRQSWGYHAMKGWYFAPALKHYRVIKTVTDTGAVRLTDTFKFKHHALQLPEITQTDRIVKATQALTRTLKGNTTSPPDEMAAIAQLRAIILGSHLDQSEDNDAEEEPNIPHRATPPTTPTPARPTYEPPTAPPIAAFEQPVNPSTIEPDFDLNPPLHGLGIPPPALISQEEDEEPTPCRYNLRSRAHAIANSVIEFPSPTSAAYPPPRSKTIQWIFNSSTCTSNKRTTFKNTSMPRRFPCQCYCQHK